jgi:hypothetical protein
MQPDPEIPIPKPALPVASVPPLLPASEPPIADASVSTPPSESIRNAGSGRRVLATVLSVCLGVFLADAVVSFVDDSLILLFGVHALTVIRGIVFLLAFLTGLLVYALMGLTPMIPKRLFLPVALFNIVGGLAVLPFSIYFYSRIQRVGWVVSLCQVVLPLGILHLLQGGFKLRWPLVPEDRLKACGFSWKNLSVFLLLNVFVAAPVVIAYLVVCAGLAVNHFTEGFLTLRPEGLTVKVRTYVRYDGKTVQLFPMAHVGDPGFYHRVSESFPSNSIVLMEGVTDDQNLLTNKITYKRMAATLGVAEQHEEFHPRGQLVYADVDVSQFTTNTIDLLNLVMLIHAKGVNAENLLKLLEYSPSPDFQEQLFNDLLRKRNRRVLDELNTRLPETDTIIVPWGVAHMPEISKEIQKAGFHLDQTREYVVIRFGTGGNNRKAAGKH